MQVSCRPGQHRQLCCGGEVGVSGSCPGVGWKQPCTHSRRRGRLRQVISCCQVCRRGQGSSDCCTRRQVVLDVDSVMPDHLPNHYLRTQTSKRRSLSMGAGLGASPVLPPQPRPRKASRLQSTEISPLPQLDAHLSTEDDGASRGWIRANCIFDRFRRPSSPDACPAAD